MSIARRFYCREVAWSTVPPPENIIAAPGDGPFPLICLSISSLNKDASDNSFITFSYSILSYSTPFSARNVDRVVGVGRVLGSVRRVRPKTAYAHVPRR